MFITSITFFFFGIQGYKLNHLPLEFCFLSIFEIWPKSCLNRLTAQRRGAHRNFISGIPSHIKIETWKLQTNALRGKVLNFCFLISVYNRFLRLVIFSMIGSCFKFEKLVIPDLLITLGINGLMHWLQYKGIVFL